MEVVLSIPFHPNKNIGGVGSVARNMVSGFNNNIDLMEKKNVKIHILSPIENGNEQISSSDHLTNRSYSVKIHPILTGMNYAGKNLNKILSERKIDIIHSHDPYIALQGVNMNLTTYFTLHGVIWEEYKYRKFKIYPYPTMLRLKKLFKKLNKFLAISPYIENEVNKYFNYPKSKISIIENPISQDFFQRKDDFNNGQIFFPGVISKRKNQLMMCKVINELVKNGVKELKVIFTGNIIDHDYNEYLLKYIRNNNIGNFIDFKGNVSFDDVLSIYHKSNCVVLTSKQETAPMVISEAMASSNPIISNNVCGAPYMIEDGIDGFLYENINGLYESIIEVLNNKKKTLSLGSNGYQKARKRWDNIVITKKIINYYFNNSII